MLLTVLAAFVVASVFLQDGAPASVAGVTQASMIAPVSSGSDPTAGAIPGMGYVGPLLGNTDFKITIPALDGSLPVLDMEPSYGIIGTTVQAFNTRPSAAAAVSTLTIQRMMAAIRGTPTTNGTNFFAITDITYGLGIAFILALIIGAAYVFARRLRYVAQATTTKMSTSGALAPTGEPQAPQRYLVISSATSIDDMRRIPDDDRRVLAKRGGP